MTDGDLLAQLHEHNMDGLWTRLGQPPARPEPSAVPFLWSFDGVGKVIERAGEEVSLAEAERRVIMLINPALREVGATSATLQANFQLVLPGETARAHRHTMSAIRFVVSGSGAHTIVDGRRVEMEPGDLILTPNWAWHDHVSDSGEPVLWLDGLDRPLVARLEQEIFERYPQAHQPVTGTDERQSDQGSGIRLRAVDEHGSIGEAPIVRYPWQETEALLAAAAGRCAAGEMGAATTEDDIIVEYVQPGTGSSATATIGCFAQWLRPGVRTRSHRQTSTTVYHVVRGSGTTHVDGVDMVWRERDTFLVPAWAAHSHENSSPDAEAVLFSYSDEPALRALGLYREEPASDEISE